MKEVEEKEREREIGDVTKAIKVAFKDQNVECEGKKKNPWRKRKREEKRGRGWIINSFKCRVAHVAKASWVRKKDARMITFIVSFQAEAQDLLCIDGEHL